MLTIARLIEAMVRIAVGSKDGNLVSTVLQSHSSVNDESLGSANAQIRVEEDNVLLLLHPEVVLLTCLCLRAKLLVES